MTTEMVEDLIKELEVTRHIWLYEVDSERFFEVRAFEKHQSAAYRRGLPKYPARPKNSSIDPGQDSNSDGSASDIVLEGKGSERKGKEAVADATSAAPKKTKDGTMVSEDFEITPHLKEWAIKGGYEHIDLGKETAKFIDHHAAKGTRFKDWDRAWQKWIRQADEWSAKGRTTKPPERQVSTGAGQMFQSEEEANAYYESRGMEKIKLD
jgi:hypothetical protein